MRTKEAWTPVKQAIAWWKLQNESIRDIVLTLAVSQSTLLVTDARIHSATANNLVDNGRTVWWMTEGYFRLLKKPVSKVEQSKNTFQDAGTGHAKEKNQEKTTLAWPQRVQQKNRTARLEFIRGKKIIIKKELFGNKLWWTDEYYPVVLKERKKGRLWTLRSAFHLWNIL